jgi:secondary thiamine-phosphate synthase enzyme
MIKRISVRTNARSEFVDITAETAAFIRESGVQEGSCLVYCPHTTCGITVNENADPDVSADIIRELDSVVPWNHGYRHSEGNSAAHIKASLTGSSALIPIDRGELLLGIWQALYLCEFDGPRTRTVVLQVR